ncbi:YlxR family protein [Leptothermofonsia sichuanensis E412]|uniref:YlxR family protein n=1 Tax=Leptothermofonsia sichuanensis TaxID=2917832 RepID=UPI001CA78A52|nr:YlxR family protein [Leptothermofonsia sichuanensis]QZZ22623.1 YlxR family protein [Leptothermofonsia sichuanensis E412]
MEPNYRRCLSCRKVAHRSEFWRIVRVYPSQTIELDQGMGRSAYLCPQASCLQAAQRKDRLGRVLKVPVPESIYNALWSRLAQGQEGVKFDTENHKQAFKGTRRQGADLTPAN